MSVFVRENFGLRMMAAADSKTVLDWRNDNRVRQNMYTDHIITEAEHRDWLARVLEGSLDRYCIFEFRRVPVGVVGYNRIDWENGRAMLDSYLGETTVPPGLGAAMEMLALDHGFDEIGLRKLSCEVLEFNTPVVRLHRQFGFEEEGFFAQEVERDGRLWGIHRLAMFRERWAAIRRRVAARLFSGNREAMQ